MLFYLFLQKLHQLEVKNVIEMRDELKSKLKEVGRVIPKMSEAILSLRNEVSEGKKGAAYKC